MTNNYFENHTNSGFKVGDKVKVLRSAEDFENGWDEEWVSRMDSSIGTEDVICADFGKNGFELKYAGFNYPYFVLEKIE